MLRLFYLMIAAIFAFMLWRIVQIVMRTSGGRRDGVSMPDAGGPHDAEKPYMDVKDAEFEDLKPPPKEDAPGGKS